MAVGHIIGEILVQRAQCFGRKVIAPKQRLRQGIGFLARAKDQPMLFAQHLNRIELRLHMLILRGTALRPPRSPSQADVTAVTPQAGWYTGRKRGQPCSIGKRAVLPTRYRYLRTALPASWSMTGSSASF